MPIHVVKLCHPCETNSCWLCLRFFKEGGGKPISKDRLGQVRYLTQIEAKIWHAEAIKAGQPILKMVKIKKQQRRKQQVSTDEEDEVVAGKPPAAITHDEAWQRRMRRSSVRYR